MKNLAASDVLDLDIVDFGPILKAELALRPLTVLVGPSNTGKSYLAILIYAFHKFFDNQDPRLYRNALLDMVIYERARKGKISQEVIEWIRENFGKKWKITIENGVQIPDFLIDTIDSLTSRPAQLDNILKDEICRCFGITRIESLIRKGSKNGARFLVKKRYNSDFAMHETSISKRKFKIATKIPEDIKIEFDNERKRRYFEFLRMHLTLPLGDDNADQPIRILADLIIQQAFGSLNFPAFYLPADKTGFMHAHSAIVRTLIAGASRRGLPPSNHKPTLSGVQADFLDGLLRLGVQSRHQSRPDLGTPIENGILGGSVQIRESEITGYPSFAYRQNGWRQALPLMNASSMISELAPLILYLRHLVEPDNVLIVEEPESHLHPGMQVEFTRQLAMIVRAGVRVIVTTHSEWILEELANLVQISELSDDARHGLPNGEAALRTDQVGAWLFEPQDGGSVVKEIRLEETGLYPSGFSRVSAALHNNWAEIRSRIGKSE